MFVYDHDCELWCHETVQCVLVSEDGGIQVELRNSAGRTFLRKRANTWQAALNEGEYLRLLLRAGGPRVRPGTLKPFALVIDDDRKSCESSMEALKVSGMRAYGCRNNAESVSTARELTPDLIVMDYRLADRTGEIICRLLRDDEVTAMIPIIALTAASETFQVDLELTDAVLAKPCELETLTAAARLFVRHLSPIVEANW